MGSNADPNDNHNCGMCNRSDSANNMVGCDLCGMWAHFDCAGVTDSIGDLDRSWKCNRCKEEMSSRKSRTSHRSSTSQRSKLEIQLSLQLVEEDQRLRLKDLEEEEEARKRYAEQEEAARKKAAEEEERARLRRMEEERRYMKEKFDLLRAKLDSANDGASRRSSISGRTSREKVQEWLSRRQGGNNNPPIEVPPLLGQIGVLQSANPTSLSQIGASADATMVDPPPGMILPAIAAQQSGAQETGLVPPNSTSTPQSSRNPPGIVGVPPQTTTSNVPCSNYPVSSAVTQLFPTSSSTLQGNPPMIGHGLPGLMPTSSGILPVPPSTNAASPFLLPPPPVTTAAFPPPVFPMPPVTTAAFPPPVFSMAPVTTVALPAPVFSMPPSTTAAVPPPVMSLPPIPSMSGPWLPSSFALPGTFPGGIYTSAGTGVQPIPSYWLNQGFPVLPCGPQPPLVPQGLSMVPNPQQVNNGPSAAQLAARQVLFRELPKFTGDPEDWPMFYSAFCNTTQACGYSDAENLARLQRCLDGPALLSVKSRLLLPESVPYVIQTLQKIYGRPKVLIHSLLN